MNFEEVESIKPEDRLDKGSEKQRAVGVCLERQGKKKKKYTKDGKCENKGTYMLTFQVFAFYDQKFTFWIFHFLTILT